MSFPRGWPFILALRLPPRIVTLPSTGSCVVKPTWPAAPVWVVILHTLRWQHRLASPWLKKDSPQQQRPQKHRHLEFSPNPHLQFRLRWATVRESSSLCVRRRPCANLLLPIFNRSESWCVTAKWSRGSLGDPWEASTSLIPGHPGNCSMFFCCCPQAVWG